MKENLNTSDCFLIEGKLALPYSYLAGKVGSTFITTLRDKKKILGVKCSKCGTVFIPPRQTCERCLEDIGNNWVELKNTGVVTNYTVVHYDDKHLPRKAPFVLALIKLDGADSPFIHILEGVSAEENVIGMRVQAVFAEKNTNTIMNIDHFEPAREKRIAISDPEQGDEGAKKRKEKRGRTRSDAGVSSNKVIITAALSGAATMRHQNPHVPYTAEEFAEEAAKCYEAGAAMVHVHARSDDGMATHEIPRIQATYDAIKDKTPDLIVNLSSAVGMAKTSEQRIAQIIEVKPEMASLNTNTMNFGMIDRKTGRIFIDYVFENTFTMLQDFGKAMEENGVKPEIEIYDIGGFDNFMLIDKQGIFSKPYNFNFVWGVAGGQAFRADSFIVLKNALPPESNFTTCGVGTDEFPAITQSCLLGGHMRVGLEDNIRLPNGVLARGSWELVQWAARIAECLGRQPATPREARQIMGLRKQ